MPKLSDTQTLLLSHASQQTSGSLYPIPDTLAPGGGRSKALAALVRSGFAEERETSDAACVHREDGDLRFGLFVTAAGLNAIGVEPTPENQPAPAPAAADPDAGPARQTKAAAVLALLRREQGATLSELIAATGWLPHTTRAALTGLRKKGHAIAKSKRDEVKQHPEFKQASGELSAEGFQQFLTQALGCMAVASAPGSIHFICMDWRGLQTLLAAGDACYTELKNLVVWDKGHGGMGALYRSQHELIAVYKSGTAPHCNNVKLGAMGRNRTNVWAYPGMNSFQCGRNATLALHPTIKPVALCADAMLDCSARGDLILDPFGGSGSTLLAAERTGRHARLIELDPHYVDVILHRALTHLGLGATNLWTGAELTPAVNRNRAKPKPGRRSAEARP